MNIKPSNIKVGQFYTNKRFPKAIYLGCKYQNKFRKQIVVIKSEDSTGNFAVPRTCNRPYWRGFEPCFQIYFPSFKCGKKTKTFHAGKFYVRKDRDVLYFACGNFEKPSLLIVEDTLTDMVGYFVDQTSNLFMEGFYEAI